MKLFLKDGTSLSGKSFGANVSTFGEVVFNTGMTGYVESLTDPSYAGQILVCTYPLIGNYGVPSPSSFESSRIQVAGLVVANYSENYSHHSAQRSLGEWLKKSNVPAMTGVDTRALTKKLREHGVMLGALGNTAPRKFIDPNEENLVAKVSPKQKRIYGDGPIRIVLIDCGAKENIVRKLSRKETTVIRVPWDYDFTGENYRALAISNGPGNPTQCTMTIEHIKRKWLKGNLLSEYALAISSWRWLQALRHTN
jgi:carbamoyl-phosphate synthase small subunit